MAPAIRPVVKWAGGKRWLAPAINQMFLMTESEVMVEPFAGGMAVSLYQPAKLAIINDINKHLVNLYEVLRAGTFPAGFEWLNDEAYYYKVRDEFNESILRGNDDGPVTAVRFLYLNRYGFNGLCRYNKSGLYNVPFGSYKRGWTPDFIDLGAFCQAIKSWVFESLDFAQIRCHNHEFVYCDPPFLDSFDKYTDKGFDFAEHMRLALWAYDNSGPILVSNGWTLSLSVVYAQMGFDMIQVEAPRRISANGDRTPALEMLAWKNMPDVSKAMDTKGQLRARIYTPSQIVDRLKNGKE